MSSASWFHRLLAPALLSLAAAASVPAGAQIAGSAGPVVSTDQLRAELMAYAPEGADAGRPVWVGLQFTHAPGWHTYWKNPGDSGLPTELQWTLPPGVSAGPIAWPAPRKIPIGNLANYGYEDTVLLPVPLTVAPEFRAPLISGAMEVRLKASWLVCKRECIPQEGSFALQIPTRSSTAGHAEQFQAAFRAAPTPLANAAGQATSTVDPGAQALALRVQGLPQDWRGKTLQFFPETPEIIETAAPWTQAWNGDTWNAKVPLSALRTAQPTLLPVVLALGDRALRAELPVRGAWPSAAAMTSATAVVPGAFAAGPAAPLQPAPATFWLALAGALLGGLILNLMPCVFPVLAIKVLGFARHAGDRRAHRHSGFAYTAGVLLSFLALGALLLGLRSAGAGLGWGFQLQDPAVVASLAALFTLIGLNLSGLFEVSRLLPSRLASAHLRHPTADSFLTGVLAVAVAAPCTAPFMGASIGLAVALPAAQALAIFSALGLGLALPFLVASLVPAFARALPRPGAWMDTFRKAMAFPMFATVAWLVWVLGQQSGVDGAGALLALLVAGSAVVWSMSLGGRARAVLGTLSVLMLVWLGWGVGPYVTRAPDASRVASAAAADGWQVWEPGRVDQIVATGQPVLVDFTAAWCVTCQYNRKTTLSDAEVLADLAQRKVALLRADWTRRDPAITAALRQLGRSGVPAYVLYQSGKAPVLLSEILSVRELRGALARL